MHHMFKFKSKRKPRNLASSCDFLETRNFSRKPTSSAIKFSCFISLFFILFNGLRCHFWGTMYLIPNIYIMEECILKKTLYAFDVNKKNVQITT